MSLYISFTKYDLIGEPVWTGLGNFKRLFLLDSRYHKAIGITFLYVVTAVPLRLAFALFIAMLLCQKRRLIGLYRLAYYLPSIVGGSVAIALVWRMFFGANGPASSIAAWFGVKGVVSLIGHPRTALGTIIALYIWQFGSSMLIFLAGLKNIPESFYEAAVVDGAGSLVKFFRITLPLLSPVILFNLVMQTIHGFLMFTQAWIITQGGPMDSTMVYVVYMFLRAFQFYDMGAASAMAWVLLLIVSAFTLMIFGTSGTGCTTRPRRAGSMIVSARRNLSSSIYHAVCLILVVVMIYPVLWMIMSSFKTQSGIFRGSLSLIPKEWAFRNYVEGWRGFGRFTFGVFFGNSFIIAVVSTLGTMASAALVGYGFARVRFAGRNILFGVMLATMMLPSQIIMVPQYLIFHKLGWINTFLPLIVPWSLGNPFFIFLAGPVHAYHPRRAGRIGADRRLQQVRHLRPHHPAAVQGRAGDRGHLLLLLALGGLPAAGHLPEQAAPVHRLGGPAPVRRPHLGHQLGGDVRHGHPLPGPGHQYLLPPAALHRGRHQHDRPQGLTEAGRCPPGRAPWYNWRR